MEHLNEVSNILWRERNLLELLAFKLDTERLLARAGRTRWLARADHEVEVVIGVLKAVELERSIGVQALVAGLGLDSDPTLVALADHAPSEWAGIFTDHRRALLQLASDVDRAARRSRSEMPPPVVIDEIESDDDRGAVAVSRALADIVAPARDGSAASASGNSHNASHQRRRAVVRPDAVVARLPSLVDFLR